MKTKRSIRTIAMVLIITFAVSFLTIGVSAQDNVNWSQKISSELLEVMSGADSKEKIPVWVWFTDIEQEEVEEQVKAETGLTEEDLDVAFKAVDDKLIYELNSLSDDAQKQEIAEKIDAYLDATQIDRQEEKERTDKYIKARRNIARDMYVEKNEENINELKLPQDEIIFQSELTSSVIIKLTKSQINRVAKSKEVVSIDLHTEEESVPPVKDTWVETISADDAAEQFGLTGEGVNVLVHDHGCVRSDRPDYEHLSNVENLKVVVDEKIYTVSNTAVMPGSKNDGHPNLIAETMQAFAPDVNIYSVGYGEYDDVEWAIRNCDIDLINGSINYYVTEANYSSDATAKWFDTLINTHNVTLVASAGNDEGWQEWLWPNVISPSSGYNCISAGAYNTDGNSDNDYMHYYRHNPTDSKVKVNYKPDMVIAADSTSEASPCFSGVIAMMLQLKPSLASQPELIKAILMASCHRKVKPSSYDPDIDLNDSKTWEKMSDGLTQKQGAGAIDAYKAISIVLKGNYGIGKISAGTTSVNIVEKTDNANLNVSLVWFRDNKFLDESDSGFYAQKNIPPVEELGLSVSNETDSKYSKVSTIYNTCKQMVYLDENYPSGNYIINVTKETEPANENEVDFAYAWSSNDISVNHIKFTTSNSDCVLTKEEVESQLSSKGIGAEMFTVSFDSSVKSIGESALSNLVNMKTVNIHEGIEIISDSAFENCTALETVTIPESVTKIGANAFYKCTNLSEVYFQSIEEPEINSNAFSNIAENAKGYLEGYAEDYAGAYDDLTIIYRTDIRTIYFLNKQNWEDLNVYLWKYRTDRNNGWPGEPMKYEYTNLDGCDVYSITLDYNKYDMAIINDGASGKQTLNLGAGLDGVAYYVPESTNDKYFLFDTNREYINIDREYTVPQIHITTADGNGTTLQKEDDYVEASITINDTDSSVITDSILFKVRGNSTASPSITKKAFTFKFDSKKDVLGMGKAKKWALLANAFDPTLMRNYIAFDFAQNMDLEFTSQQRYVELWVDDSYRGCYVLTEPVEEGSSRVDIDIDSNDGMKDFLVELELSRVESDVSYFTTNGIRFAVKEPEEPNDEQLAYINSTMDDIMNVIKEGDQEAISKKIDIPSFTRFYLLNELFKTLDFDFSSVFFYYKDGVLYCGPAWDYDLAAGNANPSYSTVGDAAANPTGLFAADRNIYKYLCSYDWFKSEICATYLQYYDYISNITAQGGLIDTLIETYGDIYDRNFNDAGWSPSKWWTTLQMEPLTTFSDNVEYLRDWLYSRNVWLSDYYDLPK